MCMIKQKILHPGDDFVLELFCESTGKPISIANNNGMYCSSRCDEADDIAAKTKRRDLINKVIDSVEW